MRGVFAMVVFLLLATSLVAMIAAARNEEREFTKSVENSMRKKELFYAARDSESLFWQSARAAMREWAEGCASLPSQCDTVALDNKLNIWIPRWRSYVENGFAYHSGPPADFSVSVLEGDYTDPSNAEPYNWRVIRTIAITLKHPAAEVYIPTVYIGDSGSTNAILVKVSDGNYTTYGVIGRTETTSCFLTVVGGGTPAGRVASRIILPDVAEIAGLNYCIPS